LSEPNATTAAATANNIHKKTLARRSSC
jgi:hypothetical protein